MKNLKQFQLSTFSLKKAFIFSGIIGVSISYSDFYLFHLMLLILIFVQFLNLKQNNFKFDYSILSEKYVLPLAVFLLWYVFSLLWTPNLLLGFKYIFYLSCGIFLSLTIITNCKKIKNFKSIFNLLSYAIGFQIIIGLIESFSNFRMPISSYSQYAGIFGKEPINFNEISNVLSYSNYRPPTGFHWNTNDFAVCMIIALPFFLCHRKFIVKLFGTSAIVVLITMTASRAAFLALILIIALYLIVVKKRIGTLLFVWISSISLLWGMLQLQSSENPRLNELANSLEAFLLYLNGDIDLVGSIGWRRQLIDNGLTAFQNSYGFGLGAGGTVAHQEMIGPVAGRFTSMHNFWIEVLVEGGAIVATMFFIWIFSIANKLFIISKNAQNKEIKYYG